MGKRPHFMTGFIAPLQVEPGSEVRVYEEPLATERMPAAAAAQAVAVIPSAGFSCSPTPPLPALGMRTAPR